MKNNLNCLFVPSPGLGSESLVLLATLLKEQINGTMWMLDYPNDGSNISDNYNFANSSQALIEASEMLDYPILLAHSTGAMFVQSIPALEQLTSGLILIATAPNMSWKNEFNKHMQQNMTPEIEHWANKYAIAPSDDALRKVIIASLQFSFMPNSLAAGMEVFANLPINHKAAEWSDHNFDPVYEAKFIPNKLPCLIICGEFDQIISLKLYSANPKYHRDNILIRLINGAGHYPWFDNSTAVINAVKEFVTKFELH